MARVLGKLSDLTLSTGVYGGKKYYQEGDRVYSELDVHDAYRRALNTWAKWVDYNVDPNKPLCPSEGYSSSHFRCVKLFVNLASSP
ncbi:hypothetical protein EJB05_47235, partial [Eragrostis curvula]